MIVGVPLIQIKLLRTEKVLLHLTVEYVIQTFLQACTYSSAYSEEGVIGKEAECQEACVSDKLTGSPKV